MVSAVVMFLTSAFSAWAAQNITITFVRHGESEGNVSCCIDTTIPGPHLTTNGQTQAQDRANQLASDGIAYDGIYYSDMVRTQETAAPFATLKPTLSQTELAGLHEVQAGIYEGAPQNSGFERLLYVLPALAWASGLYFVPMPGSPDLTGANFQSRYNGAVEDIYNSGDQKPVAFSHGLSIMAWTLMNVDNPDLSLLLGHPLGNTAVVTVNGNPTDGWTLVSWDGTAVSQNPALLTKLFVDTRKLITVPQMAIFNVIQAIGTRDISTIAGAIRDGVVDTAKAVVNYPVAVVKSVVQSIQTGTVIQPAPPPAPVQAVTPTATLTSNDVPAAGADKPSLTSLSAKQVSTDQTQVPATTKDSVPSTPDTVKVALPKVELPKIDLPKVDLPKVELPKVSLPKLNVPKVELPKISIPKINVPNVAASKADDNKDNGSDTKADKPKKVEKPKNDAAASHAAAGGSANDK